MCCTHSNLWVELFWNSVVNTNLTLISSCVLFWKPNKSTFSSTMKTQRLQDMAPVAATNTTARIIVLPSFIVYTYGRFVLKIFPHRDVEMWGCVFVMSRFRRAWSSLNFYSLCNFRDLYLCTNSCNTPKRKENLKSHMTPLSKVFVNKILTFQ